MTAIQHSRRLYLCTQLAGADQHRCGGHIPVDDDAGILRDLTVHCCATY